MTTVDQQWLSSLVDYVKGNGMSFSFWCLNPDSGDTGGILQDDWQTVNVDKMNALKPARKHPGRQLRIGNAGPPAVTPLRIELRASRV